MDCFCDKGIRGMIPNSFQRTPLGRCKMCRGWRRGTPEYFTLREILSAELPGALRVNVVIKKDTLKLVPTFGTLDKNGDPTLDTRIHRDNADRVVDAIRISMRRL